MMRKILFTMAKNSLVMQRESPESPSIPAFFSAGKFGQVINGLFLFSRHEEVLAKLIADSGNGKTALIDHFCAVAKDEVSIISIDVAKLTEDEIIDDLLNAANIEPSKGGWFERMKALEKYAQSRLRSGYHVFIILDNAHILQQRHFEEIRLLTNLYSYGKKLFQFLLVGDSALNRLLALKENRGLAQRMASSFILEPLDVIEVAEYVGFYFANSSASDSPILTTQGIKTLWQTSAGRIEYLNRLLDYLASQHGGEDVLMRHINAAIDVCSAENTVVEQGYALPRFSFSAIAVATVVVLIAGLLLAFKSDNKAESIPFKIANTKNVLDTKVASEKSGLIEPEKKQKIKPVSDIFSPHEDAEKRAAFVITDKKIVADKKHRDAVFIKTPSHVVAPNAEEFQSVGVTVAHTATAATISSTEKAASWEKRVTTDLAQVVLTDAPAEKTDLSEQELQGLIERRLKHSDQWLASSAPNTATIQLLLSGVVAKPEPLMVDYFRLLPANLDKSKFYIYRTRIFERNVFGILYDEFPSKRIAQAAIASLPSALKANKPIVRTVGGIRKELEELRGQMQAKATAQ